MASECGWCMRTTVSQFWGNSGPEILEWKPAEKPGLHSLKPRCKSARLAFKGFLSRLVFFFKAHVFCNSLLVRSFKFWVICRIIFSPFVSYFILSGKELFFLNSFPMNIFANRLNFLGMTYVSSRNAHWVFPTFKKLSRNRALVFLRPPDGQWGKRMLLLVSSTCCNRRRQWMDPKTLRLLLSLIWWRWPIFRRFICGQAFCKFCGDKR